VTTEQEMAVAVWQACDEADREYTIYFLEQGKSYEAFKAGVDLLRAFEEKET
jgi:hypothetical protein